MATATRAAAALLLLLLAGLHGLHVVRGDGAGAGGCSNVTQLTTRIENLLAEYDREDPPAAQVVVELFLYVRHASVHEYDASVRLIADLKMSWQDSRVSWEQSEWGCDSVVTSAERLWLPDVSAQNALATEADDAPLRARIRASGAISWVSRLDINVPISMELEDWPRDVQTGLFKFSSREHTISEMELVITSDGIKNVVVQEVGAWAVRSVSGRSTASGREGEQKRLVTWAVSVERRAPALALATGGVLAAAALLLLAAALLPPAARAPLCGTACFTTALWLVAAVVRLPSAGTTPLAVRVMAALCACGGAACACAALAVRVSRARARVPTALRALLAAASGFCSLAPHEGESGGESGAWAATAQLLDRVLVSALLLTVLVLLCVYV